MARNTELEDVSICGVRITNSTRSDVIQYISDNIEKKQIIGGGVNSDTFVQAVNDIEYRQFLSNITFANIDGMSVVWALRLLGYTTKERVSCPDIYYDTLALACTKKMSIYFLGASENIIQTLVMNYAVSYPDLQIAGYRNGYFSKEDEHIIIRSINDSNANILFLGLPSPKKESFIINNASKIKSKFIYGVGGMFDIEAGLTKRAPLWMQKGGLEWAFRLFQEPKRLWRRYLVNNTLFIKIILTEIANKKLLRK